MGELMREEFEEELDKAKLEKEPPVRALEKKFHRYEVGDLVCVPGNNVRFQCGQVVMVFDEDQDESWQYASVWPPGCDNMNRSGDICEKSDYDMELMSPTERETWIQKYMPIVHPMFSSRNK